MIIWFMSHELFEIEILFHIYHSCSQIKWKFQFSGLLNINAVLLSNTHTHSLTNSHPHKLHCLPFVIFVWQSTLESVSISLLHLILSPLPISRSFLYPFSTKEADVQRDSVTRTHSVLLLTLIFFSCTCGDNKISYSKCLFWGLPMAAHMGSWVQGLVPTQS